MAAVVSLMAKDKGGPAIKFQTLMWPVTDADFDTQSYKEFSDGYFLTRNMMIWFWDNYLKNPAQRREKYASPLRAAAADLAGLPPALVQTAHSDVLRDEGEAYARKLNQSGVEVMAVRYNGLIHDWGLLNPIATVPEVRTAITQVATELKRRLNQAKNLSGVRGEGRECGSRWPREVRVLRGGQSQNCHIEMICLTDWESCSLK